MGVLASGMERGSLEMKPSCHGWQAFRNSRNFLSVHHRGLRIVCYQRHRPPLRNRTLMSTKFQECKANSTCRINNVSIKKLLVRIAVVNRWGSVTAADGRWLERGENRFNENAWRGSRVLIRKATGSLKVDRAEARTP